MRRKKLLIIDDDEDIREVATLILESLAEFDVVAASSGLAGLASAGSELPDVILLDVMMPGLDGPSTLARLRGSNTTRAIPVIFLTAKVQAADRKRLSELGAAGIIAKPFDPMSLADDIFAILAREDGSVRIDDR